MVSCRGAFILLSLALLVAFSNGGDLDENTNTSTNIDTGIDTHIGADAGSDIATDPNQASGTISTETGNELELTEKPEKVENQHQQEPDIEQNQEEHEEETEDWENESGNPHRIVGGFPVSIREAPWQVALIVDKEFTCGGSLISAVWVLTAAHCTLSGRVYTVRAGSRYFKRGGELRHVQLIVRNGGYNPTTSLNDIAMLRVQRRFTFSRTLQPVRLAGPRMRLPRGNYFITGWGTINQNLVRPRLGLRGVNLRLVSRRSCRRDYAGRGGIPRLSLCASAPGRDSCFGDSGGALVHGRVQYGIVSFGEGCARRRFPGVYTDVRYQRKWITLVARKFNGLRQSRDFIKLLNSAPSSYPSDVLEKRPHVSDIYSIMGNRLNSSLLNTSTETIYLQRDISHDSSYLPQLLENKNVTLPKETKTQHETHLLVQNKYN